MARAMSKKEHVEALGKCSLIRATFPHTWAHTSWYLEDYESHLTHRHLFWEIKHPQNAICSSRERWMKVRVTINSVSSSQLSLTKRYICLSEQQIRRLKIHLLFSLGQACDFTWFYRDTLLHFKIHTTLSLNGLEKRRKQVCCCCLSLQSVYTAKTKSNFRLKFHMIQSLFFFWVRVAFIVKWSFLFCFVILQMENDYLLIGKFNSGRVLISSKPQKLIQQLAFSFWVPQKSGNHISSNKSMEVLSSSMPQWSRSGAISRKAFTRETFQKWL